MHEPCVDVAVFMQEMQRRCRGMVLCLCASTLAIVCARVRPVRSVHAEVFSHGWMDALHMLAMVWVCVIAAAATAAAHIAAILLCG
jgi:hypothetical protein